MNGHRTLVVMGSQTQGLLLKLLLEERGVETVCVDGVEPALAEIAGTPRDLLIVEGELAGPAGLAELRARTDAANLLGTARAHAVDLISSARTRSEKLAVRSNEHAARMLQDAELRLAVLEDQRHVIEEFAFELRSLSATDRIVEVDAPAERLGLLAAVEAEVASQGGAPSSDVASLAALFQDQAPDDEAGEPAPGA